MRLPTTCLLLLLCSAVTAALMAVFLLASSKAIVSGVGGFQTSSYLQPTHKEIQLSMVHLGGAVTRRGGGGRVKNPGDLWDRISWSLGLLLGVAAVMSTL